MEEPTLDSSPPETSPTADRPETFSAEWDRVAFFLLGAILMLMGLQITGLSQLSDGLLRSTNFFEAYQGTEPDATTVAVTSNWVCGFPAILYLMAMGLSLSGTILCPPGSTAAWMLMVNLFLCIIGCVLCAYFGIEYFRYID